MRRRTPGFLFLGATALIAGCGGGGSQSPGAAGRYVPPVGQSFAMTTASLTVQIPARGSQAARRNPKWVSPGSATLGVRVVPIPIPSPLPTEQVFTLPSPGPAPTSTTLNVAAPVANDNFFVTAYDGGGHPLSMGNSGVTAVAPSTTNSIPITLLGVPSGVVFSVNGSSTPAAWRVLTNMGADQTAIINAAPVDAQNNLIPGTLAVPAPVNGTGGVQLSSASIMGATTLTATYPHGTNTQGTVTSPLTLNAGASSLNVGVNADSYVFAYNNDYTVQVIDALTRTQVGPTLTGTNATQIAALSGCNSGAGAVEGISANADYIAIPAPSVSNPTPAPTIGPVTASLLSASPILSGIGADGSCNAYWAVSGDINYPLAKFSGFDSTITSNPMFGTGFATSGSISVLNGQVYVAANNGSSSFALTMPLSGSPPAATTLASASYPSPVLNAFVAGSGSTVFLVTNTCSGQPVLQMLSGGSAVVLNEFAATGPCCSPIQALGGVAEAADGTVYMAGVSAAGGNPNTLFYAPIATVGDPATPGVPIGGQAFGVALTPDQRYVCVLEAPTASSGQIEFFQRSPTPTLVGTVALSSTAQPVSFSIGP